MSDKLVFDLAQEVEGSPSVFVRKDWLNILDNQNQNYNNNQTIIDTSQLSNSNKYMSYREAYLSIPFLITLGKTGKTTGATEGLAFTPGLADGTSSCDYALGLKNWFGQIIHSFTLDYNGTTIVQQTPYINMWNSFKLMTSLSLDDVNTQGATIGFYPDDATSWQFFTPVAGAPALTSGVGTCNNTNFFVATPVQNAFNNFNSGDCNEGFLKRQQFINFNPDGVTGAGAAGSTYGSLLFGAGDAAKDVWKSYIFNKTITPPVPNTIQNTGVIQFAVIATVYLKHVHSFFNMCPLLKGVFMKLTMNLNNTSTGFTMIGGTSAGPAFGFNATSFTCSSVSNPLGGVNPLMYASTNANNGGLGITKLGVGTADVADNAITLQFRMNISVGSKCLDQQLVTSGALDGNMSKSVYLYIPAYTFNPVFEQAYLSSPVKQIKYTDVYQYQIINVGANQVFNNLLTNGIANVKSILILPFYNSSTGALVDINGTNYSANSGFITGTPVWQSPYDPAGTGTTSPMCWLTNFNVQVSGQNAIYNTERYNFEQFNNQLYGQNAVNGGLTDGITSGLIDRQKFDMCYSYYYVNVERMLPVEMSVPKSIQVLGQNKSSKNIDLYCFIEYGVEVSIDALTGARV
jgi:hypothetical protein